jgi:hypothetical protein
VNTEVIPLPSAPELPALTGRAGERAVWRFLECFTVNIRSKNTRAAHSNAKATGLYDRRSDDISAGEVERIGI